MSVQVNYPGVYIDEFAPGAPIEGVGTSTAAFLGACRFGDPNVPKKLYSWDDFLREFRNRSGTAEPPADDDYLWYAVRGFFANGGKICYATRVSNAASDKLVLDDDAASQGGGAAAQPTIKLVARVAGDHSANPIKASIAYSSSTDSELFRPDSTLFSDAPKDAKVIEVQTEADAAKFRPTDLILIGTGTGSETATVSRIEGKLIRLADPLGAQYLKNAPVRLADLANDSTVIRVKDVTDPLHVGSVVELSQGTAKAYATVKSVVSEVMSPTDKSWRVKLQNGIGKGFSLASAVKVKSQEFDITITQATPAYSKTYAGLSMNPGHPDYFVQVIRNDGNSLVDASPVEIPNTTAAPFNRPKKITSGSAKPLVGGASESFPLGVSDYQNVLNLLTRIDDISIVCAPGVTDAGVQQALIAHCETDTKDRFAILDSRRGAAISGPGSVAEQRPGVDSPSGYAALYYPWLRVPAAVGSQSILVPPSGHVAGIYARTDNNRGVHKAPAGTEATLNGVIGVETTMSDNEQGDLNKNYGINVIRVFQAGGRAVVWGARTTATDKNWQYVNIRRLFLFLEESIQEGIRWAVFEPNNQGLWQKLKRTLNAFLTQQWRDGALFGEKAEEAFYVRIDEALNPDNERALGRLYIEIGVRPSYPAEFIIVRIGIWQGGSEVSEA